MNQLHQGAKWLFRFRAYISIIFLSLFFGWFIFPVIGFFLSSSDGGSLFAGFLFVLLSLIFYLIIIVVVGEFYSRLAYKNWFYEFTSEGLKLERGIIWKRYSNVPYQRIQNVDITRGILARMLGFSSVMIQTAGYSAQGKGAFAEGYIPAVDMKEAEKIRSFVMKKISGKSSRGM